MVLNLYIYIILVSVKQGLLTFLECNIFPKLAENHFFTALCNLRVKSQFLGHFKRRLFILWPVWRKLIMGRNMKFYFDRLEYVPANSATRYVFTDLQHFFFYLPYL